MDQSAIAAALTAMGISTERLISVTIRFDSECSIEVVHNSTDGDGGLVRTAVTKRINRGK